MPLRTTQQRENDLATIAKRYILGDKLGNIAADFDVSIQTISNDVKEIRRRWLASSIRDYDGKVAEQMARLDILETEYWYGWQRSQEDEETKTDERKVKVAVDGKTKLPAEEKAQTRTKGRVGDPRFLEGVERCIDKRCKLFGLYAPTKVDVTWRDELKGQGIDPDAVFENVVEKYIEEMEESIQDPSLPIGVELQIEGGTGKQEYVKVSNSSDSNANDNE